MLRLSAGVILMMSNAAVAQQNCAPRDQVVGRLEADYGEIFGGGGLQNQTTVFEIWFSEKDETWTILKTSSNGISCVMASGTGWRQVLLKKGIKS